MYAVSAGATANAHFVSDIPGYICSCKNWNGGVKSDSCPMLPENDTTAVSAGAPSGAPASVRSGGFAKICCTRTAVSPSTSVVPTAAVGATGGPWNGSVAAGLGAALVVVDVAMVVVARDRDGEYAAGARVFGAYAFDDRGLGAAG